ncbi:hypothetical protein DUT90_11180 [Polaribacter sp. WD7]|uniref:hypothetical protein n=1 Tax=Polaribacter sp. WD7 TaxID=2269061 RepID=UPI000DF3A9F2|nr:hypothetical protein [Polaribacter sp. WD7]RCS26326.1 hypothetical protein DUT90_11180 [Polaribacter sp. WD7]
MKSLNFVLLICVFTSIHLFSQDLGEINVKNQFYGVKTMKKAPKKIYINSFNVNYEFYKEAVDFKNGGNGGRIGGNKGSATARAAIGLGGIQANLMQEKTNKLYTNFVNRLKSEGYEIISADEAGKTELYNDWKKTTGPSIGESFSGIINTVPEGFSFFYKRKTDKGEIKKGFLGGIGNQAKLSKALGEATIADVNLFVMFTENGTNLFKGSAAKVKLKTNLRLASNYLISVPVKPKKKKGIAGKLLGSVSIKGATNDYPASSNITFMQGKVGLGSKASFTGILKEDIEINGVVEKQKVVAYQKQGSFVPTSFSTYSGYLSATADRFSTTTKWIDVDAKKYAEGYYNSCNTFLTKQLDAFFAKMK